MSLTALALLGYIVWTLVLIFLVALFRAHLVLVQGKMANSFAVDGSDTYPFLNRLCRAHANCYEAFPIIGGILILALLTGNTALTDPLALWVIAARVVQSSIHLLSTRTIAIHGRFLAFGVQLLIATYWIVLITQQVM